jgi:hypothetical protein
MGQGIHYPFAPSAFSPSASSSADTDSCDSTVEILRSLSPYYTDFLHRQPVAKVRHHTTCCTRPSMAGEISGETGCFPAPSGVEAGRYRTLATGCYEYCHSSAMTKIHLPHSSDAHL